MTHLIKVRNVDVALESGLWWLKVAGVVENSRNGRVLVAPGPVLTEYSKPTERVLVSKIRDGNPYFHLFESLWMLGGRRDVAFVSNYSTNIKQYSDDGEVFHSAYGYRWRNHFGYDQIDWVVKELSERPDSRRAVIGIWDANSDFGSVLEQVPPPKDLPCNTTVYFDLRFGKLNMTVCNRSNDVIWGCYGANAVHFSVLQEYVASKLRVEVGLYRQFSNNYHAYLDREDTKRLITCDESGYLDVKYQSENFYNSARNCVPMCHPDLVSEFDRDLRLFLSKPLTSYIDYNHPFFKKVVAPMSWSHAGYKSKNPRAAFLLAERVESEDWRMACVNWLSNRPSMQQVV